MYRDDYTISLKFVIKSIISLMALSSYIFEAIIISRETFNHSSYVAC